MGQGTLNASQLYVLNKRTKYRREEIVRFSQSAGGLLRSSHPEPALAPMTQPLRQQASSALQPPGFKQSFLRTGRSLLGLCADEQLSGNEVDQT